MQKLIESVGSGCKWLALKWWDTCKWPWKQSQFEFIFFFLGTQVIIVGMLLPLAAYAAIRSLPFLPQVAVWILVGLAVSTAWEYYKHKRQARSKPVSEVQLLEQSLQERDQADPNWDRAARVAGCRAGLKDGADATLLRKVYGDEIVDEVLAEAKAQAEAPIDRQGEKK